MITQILKKITQISSITHLCNLIFNLCNQFSFLIIGEFNETLA